MKECTLLPMCKGIVTTSDFIAFQQVRREVAVPSPMEPKKL